MAPKTIPTNSEMEALEKLIDRCTMFEVVMALSVIAGDKATHIEHAWQDPVTARPWRRVARKLEAVARTVDI